MSLCYLDFETRSGADLKEVGAHLHVTHPWADVWCIGYAFDDEPVDVVRPESSGLFLYRVLKENRTVFIAHNAQFEWQVWNEILVLYGFPAMPIERFRCTMAAGYAMALPGSLDDLSAALGIAEGKDQAGGRLAVQMAKPRDIVVVDGRETPVWWDTPEKRARLEAYCKQDVVVEREVFKRLRPLPEQEQKLWCLDAKINDRGIFVDEPAAKTALAIVQREQVEENAKIWHLTNGEINGPSEVKRMTEWIRARGVDIPSLAKQDVIDTLATAGLPPLVREVIEIRQTFAKTSTAKVEKMLSNRGVDGRLRGLLQYHAANTGRWGGRRIQPHNLPRPVIEQREIEDILAAMSSMPAEQAREYIRVFHGPPLAKVADCLRGLLCAEPGKVLTAGDFANIEGRVLAWLAGETWKLDAFRAFDAGTGPDLYLVAAARIYHKSVDSLNKKSPERQIGKVAELACLGAETQVLTSHGVKAILDVTTEDQVWDGVQWVSHQGLLAQGVRQVVNVAGTELTPDHLVLTGLTWSRADLIATSESIRSLALETASVNLPLSGFWAAHLSKFGAHVVPQRTASMTGIFAKGVVRDVTRAPKSKPGIIESISGGMRTWYRVTPTGAVSLTAFLPVLTAATTPAIMDTPTMGGAVSACVIRGGRTDGLSLPTWSRCRDGIRQIWSWIVRTWTVGMNQATCSSSPEALTRVTVEKYKSFSNPSQSLKPVYDLANAGPLNRFTIITEQGPLLVHNCGYQGGVGAFQSMAKNYGLKVSDTEADEIKKAWRFAHPHTKQYWYDVEAAAVRAIENPGLVFKAGASYAAVRFRVVGSFLWCALPSGRALCYPYPSLHEYESEWGPKKEIRYKSTGLNYQWGHTSTYGGSLVENITQAVARDVLAEAIVRLDEAGWPVICHIHDEIVAETQPGGLSEYLGLMKQTPTWAAGLPIAVEGWQGVHYRK